MTALKDEPDNLFCFEQRIYCHGKESVINMDDESRKAWQKAQRLGFVTVCSGCGMPLKKEQVAIHDVLITHDYFEHNDVALTLVYCQDCMKKIVVYSDGGMKKAMEKYEEAQRLTHGN